MKTKRHVDTRKLLSRKRKIKKYIFHVGMIDHSSAGLCVCGWRREREAVMRRRTLTVQLINGYNRLISSFDPLFAQVFFFFFVVVAAVVIPFFLS